MLVGTACQDIGYDMVIGSDLMSDLGLRLDFQNQGIRGYITVMSSQKKKKAHF